MCNFCITPTPPALNKKRLATSRALSRIGKTWQKGETIEYRFIGGTEIQHNRIEAAIDDWMRDDIDLKVVRVNKDVDADLRIGFLPSEGSWSYVGTDNLLITDQREQTMNIGWIDEQGIGTELHELGHAWGFAHEHQSPFGGIKWNKKKVYEDAAKPPNGWSPFQVDFNIINKLSKDQVKGNQYDIKSVMHYWFDSSWTTNGLSFEQNIDLSDLDRAHFFSLYGNDPKLVTEEESKVFEAFKAVFHKKRFIGRLDERAVVELAHRLGLEASTHELKPRTVYNVWQKLNA